MRALGAMLAEDVSLHADGGGKRPAAGIPVLGFERVMKVHEYHCSPRMRRSSCVRVHQRLPGFVTQEADGELQTTALEIEDGKIVAIYVVRNPDKLKHLH